MLGPTPLLPVGVPPFPPTDDGAGSVPVNGTPEGQNNHYDGVKQYEENCALESIMVQLNWNTPEVITALTANSH